MRRNRPDLSGQWPKIVATWNGTQKLFTQKESEQHKTDILQTLFTPNRPDLPGQQPHVVVAAVTAERGQDGQVVVLVAVVSHQQLQLIGQQGQPLLVTEHPHRNQLPKETQVHPVLAGVGDLHTAPYSEPSVSLYDITIFTFYTYWGWQSPHSPLQ